MQMAVAILGLEGSVCGTPGTANPNAPGHHGTAVRPAADRRFCQIGDTCHQNAASTRELPRNRGSAGAAGGAT